ncbi:hypothetical protein SASPL_135737 [Salvia splendens]|uniref:Lipoxygenase n=1 Tax=Salvia splendens TaxID=180675 RepID=A0A8X8ZGW3_SALSN|nr:hypothetical protein SASPL_135737 [Salvia splendens]
MKKRREHRGIRRGLCSSLVSCLNKFQGNVTPAKVKSFGIPNATIYGEIIIQVGRGESGPGKAATVWLYSDSDIDPGSIDEEIDSSSCATVLRYEVEFKVEPDFGAPGAISVKNEHKHKFFLRNISLQGYNNIVHFECNSWLYPFHLTKQDRVFFPNTCYLPSQTPPALVELRKDELVRLTGNGTGERQKWEQIYDYDYYKDLGIPERSPEYGRPVLGGTQSFPYPRRLRTGRPSNNYDTRSERRLHGWFNTDIYVPPDERLSQQLSEFTTNAVRAAVHFVMPEASAVFNQETSHFESFDQIHRMSLRNRNQSVDEWMLKRLKHELSDELFKKLKQVITEKPAKFQLPRIAAGNQFASMDDDEFVRQMLAGTNPTVISSLQNFPPEGSNGVKSSIKQSDIEHSLDGLTITEAMNQWRLFKLDHHDYLMPFLTRINRAEGVCAYASCTFLFLRDDCTLKPVAIELSLPGSLYHEEISRVLRPAHEGTEAALWQLAKAHVAAADSVYHHLMELSSSLYRSWRFDEQSLPADLIKRSDNEIAEWWSEIRYVGHGDKCNETWWYEMKTVSELIETITTLIWTVSAHHAAISLGQYDYAGYPPNHPTACRKPIPYEGTMEFAELLIDPYKYFLSMLPEKFETALGIAVVDVLSRRLSDEMSLGQQPSLKWIADGRILRMFRSFEDDLEEVKQRIQVRNRDPKLKNRRVKDDSLYELLYPETSVVRSSDGIPRSGIPNSISI